MPASAKTPDYILNMGILITLWYHNKEKYKILVCSSLLSFPHITMSQEIMTHAFKIKTFDKRTQNEVKFQIISLWKNISPPKGDDFFVKEKLNFPE